MKQIAHRLHLHRLPLVWGRAWALSPSVGGFVRIWWTLARGAAERKVSFLRTDGERTVLVKGPHASRRVFLRANGWDAFALYEIFIKEVYAKALPLPSDAVIVDLGANIGMASAYFLVHAPQARITAVEPEETNRAVLERNLQGTGARIVRAAISETSGTANFSVNSAQRHHLARTNERQPHATVVVPTLSIDDLLDQAEAHKVDLLKVDIEGSERDVFGNPPQTLERVDRMVVEIHKTAWLKPIAESLSKAGFDRDLRPADAVLFDVPDVFRRRPSTSVSA